ncbi:hypothetical protein K523DRAFT_381036, partial [Schizophyllum commune Tattone D]
VATAPPQRLATGNWQSASSGTSRRCATGALSTTVPTRAWTLTSTATLTLIGVGAMTRLSPLVLCSSQA